ncbi:MAG: hypothetical protein A2Y33_10085 [Spirochaetes bacterium GWF1_51_8]|nr:MAG: hypothetical protein A2Y33_10085 [Spirochaetes bacterium GWF1_51_8]
MIKMKSFLICAIVAVAALFASCDKKVGQTIYTSNINPPANSIDLWTSADLTLKVGQIVHFEHKFSGSIGIYYGYVISNTNIIDLYEDKREEPNTLLVGGSFHGVYSFIAKTPGTTLFYIFEDYRGTVTFKHTNLIKVVEK